MPPTVDPHYADPRTRRLSSLELTENGPYHVAEGTCEHESKRGWDCDANHEPYPRTLSTMGKHRSLLCFDMAETL